MKILTYSSAGPQQEFPPLSWDIGFYGDAIDTRCTTAIDFLKSHSALAISCDFDFRESKRLVLDNKKMTGPDVSARFEGVKSVLLEATSLHLPELLMLMRSAREKGVKSFDFLYIEPISYRREVTLDAPWTREFSLSSSIRYEGIRGFTDDFSLFSPDKCRLVTFLGYEGARLAQACDQLTDLLRWNKYAVFGVPGYAPGWEINALANNVAVLDKEKFNSVRYCGASSVSGAYELLNRIHWEAYDDQCKTVVAPLGTKPHTIAAALFLIERSQFREASLIYDHPERTPNRSEMVRRWHLYRACFDS